MIQREKKAPERLILKLTELLTANLDEIKWDLG
ncbi:hypothetical protein FB473_001205 [Brooklawnia cerclae]|uniref:Uncharacterized protein n=1 Tax=Brooklawnia cerclae TaxID=349934 RepID=A0ABX0SEW6_9ACTN|nr:hypothetical protein [Brooklawnia cerclae]